MRILLATKNAGKLRELRQMTADSALDWVGLADFPEVPEAPETGATFVENACQKAMFYAERTGQLTLADDSGLEVDALGGAPGVHSAHYAGLPRSDDGNNAKLIAALAGQPTNARHARFRCVMAFARPGAIICTADGHVEGRIVATPRGANGFGYDPHFWLPELDCTMAELPPEEKNARSHRGEALRRMLPQIEAYLADQG